MFNKFKTKLALRWLRQNQMSPRLTLNATDKIYLAMATKSVDKLTYVYILACHRTKNNQYNVLPETEVLTFDNKYTADIYKQTIAEIMGMQHKMPGVKTMLDILDTEINRFRENTR